MDNKIFFYVAEEKTEDNDVSIKPSWKSMNFIKKTILSIFSKDIEKMHSQQVDTQNRVSQLQIQIDNLSEQNSCLQSQMTELMDEVKKLSAHLTQNSTILAPLLADFNSKKANSDTKYKRSIDHLYRLNKLFLQNVPHFGRANELDKLQMLVNYLYDPSDSLCELIKVSANNSSNPNISKTLLSILAEIDEFNSSIKPNLLDYLSQEKSSWKKCIIFPKSSEFEPKSMVPFNDSDIEPATPVFIVSLGFDFPNSNSEKISPTVFKISN